MKICFVGAGSMGSSLGGVLTEGGLDVWLKDKWAEHVDAMNRDGLRLRNIVGMMWDKLVTNVATGAWCGVTGLPFGGLRELREIKECALEGVREVIAVAKAAGVTMSLTEPEAIWTRTHTGLPADFKPSILQDLEKGARTEIDFINGSVVRVGEEVGVPTPVNRALVAAIKGIELRQERQRAAR